MTEPSVEVPRPGRGELPLPGNYPCITLQLNVTRYAGGGMGRMVLCLRDPATGAELDRAFVSTCPWEHLAARATSDLLVALGLMRYLQDGELLDTRGAPLNEP